MCAFTHEQKWRGGGGEEVGEEDEECLCIWRRMSRGEAGWWAFKFCDICSLQLECVYFYTASHKQRAGLAPLVNVPAYNSKANEIFTARQQEWGEKRGQRRRKGGKWHDNMWQKYAEVSCTHAHKVVVPVKDRRSKELMIKRPRCATWTWEHPPVHKKQDKCSQHQGDLFWMKVVLLFNTVDTGRPDVTGAQTHNLAASSNHHYSYQRRKTLANCIHLDKTCLKGSQVAQCDECRGHSQRRSRCPPPEPQRWTKTVNGTLTLHLPLFRASHQQGPCPAPRPISPQPHRCPTPLPRSPGTACSGMPLMGKNLAAGAQYVPRVSKKESEVGGGWGGGGQHDR